jgi:glycosyltransferase involved in cell wall biosynthesis
MSKLSLTIITINYNNSIGLLKTLNSINYQTNKNFEYVIIDGDSTDGSVQHILDFKHANYKYLIEKDTGIYNAFNKGINLSTGKFLLFLNSGDEMLNDQITNIIINKSNNDDFLNIYALNFIKENNAISPYFLTKKIDACYVLKNFIPHPSTIISKTLFEKIGLFNENYKYAGDHEFFVRFYLSKYADKFIVHDELIVNHYLDGSSNDKNNLNTILKEREKALNENINNSFIKESIQFYLEFSKIEFVLFSLKKWAKKISLIK